MCWMISVGRSRKCGEWGEWLEGNIVPPVACGMVLEEDVCGPMESLYFVKKAIVMEVRCICRPSSLLTVSCSMARPGRAKYSHGPRLSRSKCCQV